MSGMGEETPQDFYLPLRHRCALVAVAILTNAAAVAILVLSVMYGRREMVEWGVVMTVLTLLFCGVWLPPLFPYRLYSDRIERWELLRKVSIPLDGAVIRTKIGANGLTSCWVIHGKNELWIREWDPWRAPLCALLRERVPAEKPEETWEPSLGIYRASAYSRYTALVCLVFFAMVLVYGVVDVVSKGEYTLTNVLGVGLFLILITFSLLQCWFIRRRIELTEDALSAHLWPHEPNVLPLTKDTVLSWSKSGELTVFNANGQITVPRLIAERDRLRRGLEARFPFAEEPPSAEEPDVEISFPLVARNTSLAVLSVLGSLFLAVMMVLVVREDLPNVSPPMCAFLAVCAAMTLSVLMPAFYRMRFDASGVETRCIIPIRRIRRADIETVEHRVTRLNGHPHNLVVIRLKSGEEVAFDEMILPVPAAALHRALNRLWFESEDA